LDLADLIRPTRSDAFIREHWERRPLLAVDRGRDCYEGLFSLAAVDRLLSARTLHSSTIRVVREGSELDLGGGWAGEPATLEALLTAHGEGATIVFQSLHATWPPLGDLCLALARRFSAAFGVNAYLTPPNSQGLATHYDTHDVFVLQIAGSKHWRVFGAPLRLPLRGQPYRSGTDPGEPQIEVDLHPGDLLYVPRGFLHDAVTGEATSLHLTLGAQVTTWAAVVLAAVEAQMKRDASYRAALPPGFATAPATRQEACDQLAGLVRRLLDELDPAAAIEDAAERALLHQRVTPAGRLLDLESVPRVDGHTRLRRRPEVDCRIGADGDALLLRFNGKIVRLPDFAADEVAHLVDAAEFTPDDLPGSVDAAGRLVLVRRLIREGLLTVCR
jgi:ribosomal protein L16 Arg81 hydroxylase